MIFPPLQSSDKWMFRFPLKIPGRTGSPQRERVEFDLPSKKPPGEKTKHEFSVECMATNIMQWKYLRNVKRAYESEKNTDSCQIVKNMLLKQYPLW